VSFAVFMPESGTGCDLMNSSGSSKDILGEKLTSRDEIEMP
jgi:hypothetical protein